MVAKTGCKQKAGSGKKQSIAGFGEKGSYHLGMFVTGKEKLPHAMILSLIKTFLFSDSPEAEINGSGLIITLQKAALRT